MALPQRRDPYDDERELREVDRRDRGVDPGGGWFLGWWWIWLLVFIAIIWFAGWGWGGYGGWWWGGGARGAAVRPVYNNGGVINNVVSGNGVAILDATDKQPYVGKQFTIQNAPVQNVVNDHVLWVSANGSAPMLVVLNGTGNNLANAKINQGTRVDVTGTVEKAPPSAEATKNWNLGNDGVQRLEHEGAYVAATQVERAPGR